MDSNSLDSLMGAITLIVSYVINNILATLAILLSLLAILLHVYTERKRALLLDIEHILKCCRDTESWDDRSEYKLFSWMGTEEGTLHNYSLLELQKTRSSLIKYMQIHINMDLVKEGILTEDEVVPREGPGIILRFLYKLTEWFENRTY